MVVLCFQKHNAQYTKWSFAEIYCCKIDFLRHKFSDIQSMSTLEQFAPIVKYSDYQWLSKINRKNLTACQLAEKNSTLHVCGKHFINGKPSALYETTDPNWIPTINLGYELVTISSPESTVAGNGRRKRHSNLNQINESTGEEKESSRREFTSTRNSTS